MKYNIKLYFLFFIICYQSVYSQRTEVYDSLIFLNGNLFQANYDYYLNKGDTMYHGPFTLTEYIEEVSEGNGYPFSAINGNFKRNIADGDWVIRKGKFIPSSSGVLEDYTYSFKINGTEFIAKGSFDSGIKNTPWELYEWKISNSNINDTIFSAQLPFKNNKFSGTFRLFHQGEYLEGAIDNDQLTDKRWSFFVTGNNGDKVLFKEWIFKNNQLINMVLHENGQALIMEINQPIDQEIILEEVDFDEDFLKIIDIKASLNNPELFKKYSGRVKVRDLFFMINDRFKVLDSIFNPLTEILLAPEIKTRIEKYPLTEIETSLLNSAKNNTYAADSILHAIKEDPQINLAMISTQNVNFYVAALNTIHDQFIYNHKIIIDHYDKGNLEYIDRHRFFKSNTTTNSIIDFSVVFNEDTTYHSHTLNLNLNEINDPIHQFFSLTQDILSEITYFNDSIGTYVQEIKQQDNLLALESEIIKKYEELKNLSDSLINFQHDNIAGFAVQKEVNSFIEQIIKNYSSLETTEEKIAQAEPTLECLNQMENLIINIENVPEENERIKDAYTNRVFNPYTYTYMEEKLKQPIYRSYNEVILPGIFHNLKNLNCENIEPYSKNFVNIFEGMIRVLTQNTRREERKIRRARNAPKAAEILNLNLAF